MFMCQQLGPPAKSHYPLHYHATATLLLLLCFHCSAYFHCLLPMCFHCSSCVISPLLPTTIRSTTTATLLPLLVSNACFHYILASHLLLPLLCFLPLPVSTCCFHHAFTAVLFSPCCLPLSVPLPPLGYSASTAYLLPLLCFHCFASTLRSLLTHIHNFLPPELLLFS